ncbi:tripeptidylpeptidase II [Naegleria gruberi]|uniref:tripeptidyl-peptidase II n=1 Tax=Naegleria gruberi TaxID=5762 RepID=D2V1R3_NAEGR|nr:tripeptidylpeptidase II [Naegleria gruberi]EFC49355.1 tripeptidylpeptidase II [Naegleria gruberi]|eukprot:XP_002682099.1 tripeptidylpeptidase II [Naegleria gruberi strain NEG-M]
MPQSEYPVEGLNPKSEVQGLEFLKLYPNYDGRGVRVAIFDTGIDIGAPGLNGLTTDGKRKIIDVVDCTGSGDVDTKTIVNPDANGIVIGKTGRKLKIDAKWKELNSSNEYHVGIKSVFELYPKPLIDRVKEERKKQFQKKQTEKVNEIKEKSNLLKNSTDEKSKKELSELEKQLDLLNDLMKNYEDSGPLLDCIVFLDEKANVYRAVVVHDSYDAEKNIFETSSFDEQVVDLSNEKLMSDYSLNYEYSTFTELDLLNYSFKIYDNGNLLSIVTTSGSHGSHVAGIVGAHFPDKPELNGAAPGCQIVSCKIGDNRLGSMETGTALNRGLISCYENKCSIINMSYGEPSSLANTGIFREKLEELVYNHNVTFVTSAGNAGPNYTTCGAPASLSDSCIGVGAYVTQSMIKAQYGLSETVPDSQFTWSSRGPTEDGQLCPTISSLGAAITSVPNYTLQSVNRCNGTSMSSPQCSGCLALLYSALIAEGRKWNPYYIKKVLENTARNNHENDEKNVDEHSHHPLSIGSGLVQVLDAFKFIEKQKPFNPDTDDYRYVISIPQRNNARGIYLREFEETHSTQFYTVSIDLVYNEKTKNMSKIEFEKRFKLVPIFSSNNANTVTDHKANETPKFIKAPEFLHIPGTFSFVVQINTEILDENNVYFARIDALDCDNMEFGPVFSVPITVMKPYKLVKSDTEVEYRKTFTYQMKSGELYRQYISTPSCSIQYCKLSLRADEMDTQKMLVFHATQLLDREAYSKYDTRKFIQVSQSDVSTHNIKTVPNRTLELTFGQFWSSPGQCKITVDVEFYGIDSINISNDEIFFDGSEVARKIQLTSSLRNMEMNISAKLDSWKETLSPTNSEDSKLIQIQNNPRNTYFDTEKCSYEMILDYNLKMASDHEIITSLPVLSKLLYECNIESRMLMIFNKNKKLVKVSDYHPEKFKLKKGDYVVRAQFRHDNIATLQKLKNYPLVITHVLAKPISLKLFKHINGALTDVDKQDEKFKLSYGRSNSYALGYSGVEKDLPKEVKAGDRLTGKFQYQGVDVATVPLTFVVPPSFLASEKSTPEKENKADERTAEQKFQDYIIEQQVTYLKKLKAEALPFVNTLLENNPKYLGLLLLKLDILKEQLKTSTEKKDLVNQITQLVDSVTEVANISDLIIHYGSQPKNKTKNEDEESELEQQAYQLKCKEMDKKKDALINSLQTKLDLLLDDTTGSEISDRDTLIKQTMKTLRQFVDPTEKFLFTDVQYDLYFKYQTVALQKLIKSLGEQNENESKLYDLISKLTGEMGFNHWSTLLKNNKKMRFPDSYTLF